MSASTVRTPKTPAMSSRATRSTRTTGPRTERRQRQVREVVCTLTRPDDLGVAVEDTSTGVYGSGICADFI